MIALLVEQSCNLQCTYCYAGDGSYGNPGKMSFDTAKKVIDHFSENNNNLHINFFGGEPLLNFKLIKSVVKYCQQQETQKTIKYTYGITTNGLLLKDKIDFFMDNHFSLIVSIDGRKETHDKFRLFISDSSQGSFDKVFQNLKLVEKKVGNKIPITLRATLTPDNISEYKKDIDFFIKETPFSFAFVPQMGGLEQKGWDKSSIAIYEQTLNNYIDKLIIQNDFETIFRFATISGVVRQLHDGIISNSYCGAGRTYLSSSIDGNIFPCHRYTDVKEFNLGKVDEGIAADKLKPFQSSCNRSEQTRKTCLSCWMLNICGGGCFQHHTYYNNNIDKPYGYACKLIEVDILLAIKVYSFLHDRRPELMKKIGANPINLSYA